MCAGAGESGVHHPRVTVPAVLSPEKLLARGSSPGAFSPYTVPTLARELESAGQQGNRCLFPLENIDPIFLNPLDSSRVKYCNWFQLHLECGQGA